jgi:hypothetical protein
MKWSAALTVCAAPLAFAGILNAENLVRRGSSQVEVISESSGRGNSYSNSNNNNNNNNNNNGHQSSTTIEIQEIIIIWSNSGGGAATSTVNQVSSTAGASVATHSVSTIL